MSILNKDQQKRLIYLINEIYQFTLEQYRTNKIGSKMQWIAQRYAKKYISIVGAEYASIEPLQGYLIKQRSALYDTTLFAISRSRSNVVCFVPRQVEKMHVSYMMKPDLVESLGVHKILDEIIDGTKNGPDLTEKSDKRAIEDIELYMDREFNRTVEPLHTSQTVDTIL